MTGVFSQPITSGAPPPPIMTTYTPMTPPQQPPAPGAWGDSMYPPAAQPSAPDPTAPPSYEEALTNKYNPPHNVRILSTSFIVCNNV